MLSFRLKNEDIEILETRDEFTTHHECARFRSTDYFISKNKFE
ncbi:conserved hypothetical protein [Xenorhabdus nematophila F1]|uniref:Uncharacterized protein n=1 Tax=Xenorhabdus nematophila (strain ATCC 19061 / DSM 3370 / CCUG 14189 / LMG 1036 / NCIMB 9965 / AN6) TaxID=406817 RepID=D3VCZ2_XENNA|nr:hypothetical protein XNC1_1798 [Xenorhabdus nematophila ATCC 19061]CCW30118.1 conserved hypothetical protein [Xenorhabdus nematophila F1]CEE94008.1 hypothetical protein XNA1_4470004 [Xenorhabdus nematophila str. Anatoliense]CEF30557.1 hypothetical protein XNW1_2650030 [Xenorhabdus nematophila str. Websteri]CEK22740.1 hypothetical protein XNC2_1746 [Xenorhabdus nematophila AN6/1]